MGLFSDKCTAIVSLETGRHLTGEELAAAKRALIEEDGSERKILAAHGWGFCGHDVKKKARFCSKCGSPAPGGWVKCPSCGKWVGNESTHCWNCNHPMNPESRTDIAGGVWNRAEGLFAERFEAGEVTNMLKQGVQVQEGTAAILIDAGKAVGSLGPGRHDPESTLRSINWFGNPPPRSFVLVDTGEFVVPLRMSEGLRTADGFPVSVYAELTMRFVRSRADDFLANLMKGARTVSYQELSESLSSVLAYGVQNLCNTSTVEDLAKDPARRDQFEAVVGKVASETLKAYGLEVVRVGAADFASPEYEKIVRANAELDGRRRELEFLQKTREVLVADAARNRELDAAEREAAAGGKMDAAKSDHDLAEYMAQLAQEKGISAIERDAELELVRLARRHEVGMKEASFRLAEKQSARALEFAAELKDTENDLALKERLRAYTVEAMLKDELGQEELLKVKAREAEIQNAIDRARTEFEAFRTRTAGTAENDVAEDRERRVEGAKIDNELRRLEGLNRIDADIDRRKIEAKDAEAARMKDLTLDARISLSDDPEKTRAFVEIERIRTPKGMTEGQLLAVAAEKSDAAAEALADIANANRMSERERALYEARVQETREDRDKVLAQDRHFADTFGDVSKMAVNHGEKSTVVGIGSGTLSTATALNGTASSDATGKAGAALPDLPAAPSRAPAPAPAAPAPAAPPKP